MPNLAADDQLSLIQQLLLEAGRIMEDSSPEFALAAADVRELDRRVALLEQTASDLACLAAAARALHRLPGS